MRKQRPGSWARRGFAGLFWVGWVATLMAPGAFAVEGPSRLFPATSLTFYGEYDGLNAHARAWQGTAAHAILVDKSAGALMLAVERQQLDSLLKLGFPDGKMTGKDFVAIQDRLVSQGFALGAYEDDGEASTVYVLNGLGEPGGRESFELFLRSVLRLQPTAQFPDPTRLRNRDVRGFGNWQAKKPEPEEPVNPEAFNPLKPNVSPSNLTWWLEGTALIVVDGPRANPLQFLVQLDRKAKDFRGLHHARVNAVLDTIEARKPNVSTHPAYLASMAEGRDLAGFEPSGLFFAEAKEGQGLIGNPGNSLRGGSGGSFDELALSEALDLSRANRVVGRWGFRGKSLLTDVRFEAPTPWKRFLGQLDRRGFARGSTPPIPQAAGAFAAGSISKAGAFNEFAAIRATLKPDALAIFELAEQMLTEATSPKRRDDLLARLGPTWCVFASSAGDPTAPGSAQPTFLIGVDDAAKADLALKALVEEINADLAKRLANRVEAKPGAVEGPPALGFERLPAPDRGYRLVAGAGLTPWLTDQVQPTVLVGKSHLVVAINPTLAREAIAAEANPNLRWKPTPELARSFEALPPTVSVVNVGNPSDSSWPDGIVGLPAKSALFLQKFLHVSLGVDDPAEGRPPDLLDALGVPRNPGPALAAKAVPRRDELRALIHPSLVAASVDDRSFRVISLEAMPLSCLGVGVKFEPDGKMILVLKFQVWNGADNNRR